MLICEKEKCTGCLSCMNICSKQAISIYTDEYGKTIPLIDDEKCVNCGACNKSCPVNNPPKMLMPKKAIAAWSKNQKDVLESSSGGVGAVFAREIVKVGGVVYGSAAADKSVKHIRVDNDMELDLLRGSKYVQSDIGTTYQYVKRDLLEGKKVLFIGVPCQIAGLHGYLRRRYDNLLTVDLICHGTPPFQYLKNYIESKVKTDWDSVSFRGKSNYYLTLYKNSQEIYSKWKNEDLYYYAFYEKLCFRDNCYSCQYAQPTRCSDITIGDFWGINRSTLKEPYKGRISLVLINSGKGNEFWNSCSNCFSWEERTLEEAINPTQGNLLHPSIPHPDRNIFLKNYPQYGFERAVGKTSIGKSVRKVKIKSAIRSNLIIKKLFKLIRKY